MRKVNLPVDITPKKEYFLLEAESLLDYKKIFGNENPVHLEIGCGKGEFIHALPPKRPNINFLGIELKMKRVLMILKKIDEENHSNVRIMKLFVDAKVTEIIPAESLDVIYIQHPDPWPKRRHHKHRLIQQDFIDSLYKILKPGGTVELSTDHADYAMWIVDEFAQRKDFESLYTDGFTRVSPYKDEHIETYFEKVNADIGNEPYFMHYKKI